MLRGKVLLAVFLLCLVSVLGFIDLAYAQWAPGQPIVPCGLREDDPDSTNIAENSPCTPCGLFILARNVIDFILIGLMPPLATLFFIWGGFQIMTSGANIGSLSRGKDIMWSTVMGIVVMLCAWLIVNTLLASLSPGGLFQNWWQVSCTWDVNLAGGDGFPLDQVPGVPPGTGGQCPGAGTNLCQGNTSAACSAPSCSQYLTAISQYAGGAASANLLKAIMVTESSCNPSASSNAGAYGLMQLLPSTANQYKQYCGVPASTVINSAWLTNPANANTSICIAANFIRVGLAQGVCGSSVINIAAGYNGGPGACLPSSDCTGASCAGGQIRRWECLYDNPQQTLCNVGYNETRNYVRDVIQCTSNPGF